MPIITTLVIGARPASTQGAVTPSASSARLASQSWPMISAIVEVAVEALLPGRAERAVERAAHLRGDAQRAAVVLGDEHRLDAVADADVEQPLARAVGGAVSRDHRGRRGPRRSPSQLLAQGLREVGHRVEVADAALVHPARAPAARETASRRSSANHSVEAGGVKSRRLVRMGGGGRAGGLSASRPGSPGRSRRSRLRAVSGASEPCTALASMRLGEVGADRALRGLLRIGGAHQVAVLLDRVLAFEHLDHHRAGDHEFDQVLEERARLVHGVEALGLLPRQVHHAAPR